MSKREAQYLRRAAQLLEKHLELFPCIAVGNVSQSDSAAWYTSDSLAGRFILHMCPGKQRPDGTTAASDLYIEQAQEGGFRNHSILALCFAAAMAETNDLP